MTYLVSPHEYLFDDEERWSRLEGSLNAGRLDSEESHEDARQSCRQLALTNEFAICGHENRISFVVGNGHQVSVDEVPGRNVSAQLLAEAQVWIDEFIQENDWFRRQQEILRRKDRDGEAFLRFFVTADGKTKIRFIEPEDVFTPDQLAFRSDSSARNFSVSSSSKYSAAALRQLQAQTACVNFGIQTSWHDAESVQGYWVNGQFLPGGWVQHRKANVDFAVPRGIPVFYPVRKNLRRAEKLLRNMSVVAEVQSAIAIIRKHSAASRYGIESYAASSADSAFRTSAGSSILNSSGTHSASGGTFAGVSGLSLGAGGATGGPRTLFSRQYSPGTILDTSAGVDYQFPAAAVDASRYIAILQAELRAVASRLAMPEFMLTSDASNANYSSTMVAEGPAVRMFERLQREMISEDLLLFKRVLLNGVRSGKLSPSVLSDVRIQITPPKLSIRDRLSEVKADQILVELGAMSVEELRSRFSTVQKCT